MDGLNWLITHDFPRFKMNTIILLVKPNYCPWKCPVATFGISSQSHDWQWKIAILSFSWFILNWEFILNYLYHSPSKYVLSEHTTTRPFLIQDGLIIQVNFDKVDALLYYLDSHLDLLTEVKVNRQNSVV